MSRFLVAILLTLALASAQDTRRLDVLVQTLGKIQSPAAQASILKGMRDSLQGRRGLTAPAGWPELYAKLKDSPDEQVRSHAQALAVIFGGSAVLDEMRARLLDAKAPAEARRQALESLVAQRDPGALDALLKLAADPGPLREPALRGLTSYDDARVAPVLTGAFPTLGSDERRAALQALLARPSNAKALVAAIESGRIPKTELTAPIARQIQGLKNAELDAWLAKNFGAVSAPSEDKQKLIAKYKQFTTPELILRADAAHGRALFAQTCAVCHTLFGAGNKIGPELPGAFEDVDYLLNNILDPNAVIGKDYQQTFVRTKDGQTVAGIVTEDTERAITLKTLGGGTITVQRADVASTELSPLSLMPEGLLTPMSEEDVRDLFLYLRQRSQVPMLLTAINTNDFFNGADVRNWVPSQDAWRVMNGELSGRGNATSPVSITSEMIADDYKLSAKVLVLGAQSAAELVVSGQRNASRFGGLTLSFGGPSALALWEYRAASDPKARPGSKSLGDDQWHAIEIIRKGHHVRIDVDGKTEFDVQDPRKHQRVSPAFHLLGGELRVKELKIEPL
jgi:putative heme-binding domain-containing protein